ncbi:MAG: hypothetical protein D6790_20335 [Caldilineae bacterium]|nr:MAG: hypothetical protein D6790_20335 [Caldilineae bacterium]
MTKTICIRFDAKRNRVSWYDGDRAHAGTIPKMLAHVTDFRRQRLVFWSLQEAADAIMTLRMGRAMADVAITSDVVALLTKAPIYVVSGMSRQSDMAWWYERAAVGGDLGTYDDKDRDLTRWQQDAMVLWRIAHTKVPIFSGHLTPLQARQQLEAVVPHYGRFLTLAGLARKRFKVPVDRSNPWLALPKPEGLALCEEACDFIRAMRRTGGKATYDRAMLTSSGIGIRLKMSKAALRVEPMTHRLLKGPMWLIDIKSFYPSLLRYFEAPIGGGYYELLDKKLSGKASFADKLLLNSLIGTLNMGERPINAPLYYKVTVVAQAIMLSLARKLAHYGEGVPVYGINDSLLIYEPNEHTKAIIDDYLSKYGLRYGAWKAHSFAYDGLNQVFVQGDDHTYGTGKFNFGSRPFLSPLHYREGARLALQHAGIEVPYDERFTWFMARTDGGTRHKVVLAQRCENADYDEQLRQYVASGQLEVCVASLTNTKFRTVKAIRL